MQKHGSATKIFSFPEGFLAPKEEKKDGIGDGKREELAYKIQREKKKVPENEEE